MDDSVFIENLLESKDFSSQRKTEFKARLFNQITALEDTKKPSMGWNILLRARLLFIGALSIIIVFTAFAVAPFINNMYLRNTDTVKQTLVQNELAMSENEVDVKLNKLDQQIQNITLDNDQQLITQSDITLQ